MAYSRYLEVIDRPQEDREDLEHAVKVGVYLLPSLLNGYGAVRP